jgi:hypothetical protein
MMKSTAPLLLLSSLCAAVLTGCGSGVSTPTQPIIPVPTAFTGKVLAGTTPVVGASVQVYAAGQTGNGSAPTALTTAVTTDSTGTFSIPASSYTCSSSTAVVYIVATGGQVGSNGANSDIKLMSSPGACGTITTASTYVVNELTTVASAYAFAQFLGAGAQLGATSTNTSGITLAAGTLANLVNITTGVAPGPAFPATGIAPTAKLNSLANAVHACLVSTGSGSSACSLLLSYVSTGTSPTNILDAVLDLAKNPGVDVSPYARIYNLTLASTAFTPVLSAAPADWTLFVTYTGGGMNDPSALSIDSKGHVWAANYFSTASLFSNTGTPIFTTGVSNSSLGNIYGGTVDANDVMWFANEPGGNNGGANSISLLTAGGSVPSGSPYTSGGLNFPISIAVDQTNVSWIVDYGNSHLTLLSNSGAALSGATGYNGVDSSGHGNFIFPVAVAVDTNRNGWVANQSSNTVTKVAPDGSSFVSYTCCSGASGVAVDANNNVWVANYYGDSVGLVSAAGTVLSGSSGFTGGGVTHPQGIEVDGAGTVWVANYRAPGFSEIAGVGSKAGVGTPLSPAAGWGTDAALLEAFALAIDSSGNIWISNFGSNTLTEFIGMAVPVKTPLLGSTRIP